MATLETTQLSTLSDFSPAISRRASDELWPGWARVLLIVGSSSALWALITLPLWA